MISIEILKGHDSSHGGGARHKCTKDKQNTKDGMPVCSCQCVCSLRPIHEPRSLFFLDFISLHLRSSLRYVF